MLRFVIRKQVLIAVIALMSFSFRSGVFAMDKSPVKLQKWMGTIDLTADNPVPFTLAGNASHLGNFTAHGEVTFF